MTLATSVSIGKKPDPVTLSDLAASKVALLIAQEDGDGLVLRVAVRPGGCSGYSYEMFFDTEVADDDIVRTFGTVSVVVDQTSAELMAGSTLDYNDGLNEPERQPDLRLRVVFQLNSAPDGGAQPAPATLTIALNGVEVEFEDDGSSLLDILRDRFGCSSVKDGCSPQGQCGCCTVWVDGAPRVSCVTPARRVAERSVTTLEGMDPAVRARWVGAFCDAGASQCGFCTPGIIMRLAALVDRQMQDADQAIRSALVAHLCRCTGWQSIVEAAGRVLGTDATPADAASTRDPLLASWRAQVEGPTFQASGPIVVEGNAGFASDTAPPGSLIAIWDQGVVSTGESLGDARRGLRKVQGRRSGQALVHPVDLPEGEWAVTLQTTWVEPAYLEPDASWCRPGAVPASPLANGGAFGGKGSSPIGEEARRLADTHGRSVLALWTREEVVRRGQKRPPVAVVMREDGSGVIRMARTTGSPELFPLRSAVAAAAPGLVFEEVWVPGPPVGTQLRAAGWAEAAAVVAALGAKVAGSVGCGVPIEVVAPAGGRARVVIDHDDRVSVEVWAGEVLDETTLRSYCLGGVHQALGWVRSEGVAVDGNGVVQDLTVRSFGVLPAREMPEVTVRIWPSDLLPVNGSDAVFAATAAAAWLADGLAPRWPTRRGMR
jgi:iron-sulfur cluster assembly accessory protein